jgi:PAS domain S-box-containing protein
VFGKDKNLQIVIAQNNRDPFFILEQNGEIITSNSPGTSLLKLETNPGKITQYFDKETADNFEQLLEQAVELNEKMEVELTGLTLRGRDKIKAKLLFNCYEVEKNLYIFCTIIPRQFEFDITGEERLTLSTSDLDKVVSNKEIKHVLDKIIDIYPLTFIGKETIQKLVNKFEEHFWIKDNKGKFLLVNNSYAESLGLKSFQIEGKSFHEFIPGYLIDFFDAIEKYIKETLNCIIIDVFPITRMRSDADKEILELPLSDNDRNVVALVGISRKKEQIPTKPAKQEIPAALAEIINYFPKSAAFVNKYGVFKQTSKDFCKLFARKFNELRNLSFSDVFALDLTDKINHFIKSFEDRIELNVDRNFDLNEYNNPEYKLYLTKSYGPEKDLEGFSIFVEPIDNTDSLQYLIKSKGKMFDILVKNNPEPVFIYDEENLMFLEVNDAAVALYGYTRDEFLQMDLTDLYSPEDIQSLLDTSAQDAENIYVTKTYKQPGFYYRSYRHYYFCEQSRFRRTWLQSNRFRKFILYLARTR